MAISPTTFMKRFSQAVAAVGLTAALASSSFGASTWLGSASGTSAGNWGTATGFASNWSPTGNAGFGVLSGTSVSFGSSSDYSVTVFNSPSVSGMTFSGGALSYTFESNNNAAKVIGVGAGGITNNITSVAFQGVTGRSAPRLNLTASQTWSGTGSMTVDTVTTSGSDLTISMTGPVTIATLTSASAGKLEVTGGSTTVAGGTGPATVAVSGGVLTLDSDNDTFTTTQSNAVVSGGNLSLNGYDRTFANLSISGTGIVDLVGDNSGSGGYGVTNVTNYTQTGGEIHMEIASLASYSKVIASGSVAFGGTVNLDLTNLATPTQGDNWALFNKGSSQTNTDGSFNFSGFTSTGTGDLAGLTPWIKDGQEWKSQVFGDASGNFFVFESQTGVLRVVPEPSTYAMGAIGLATAGFFRWRSRRRAAATA